jgi:hypothetical protein
MKYSFDCLSRIAAGVLAIFAMTGTALAQTQPTQLPEPGTLAILAGGAVAALYLSRRNRKK